MNVREVNQEEVWGFGSITDDLDCTGCTGLQKRGCRTEEMGRESQITALSPFLSFLFIPFSNWRLLIQYDKDVLKETNTSDNEIAECIFIIPQVKWQIENF